MEIKRRSEPLEHFVGTPPFPTDAAQCARVNLRQRIHFGSWEARLWSSDLWATADSPELDTLLNLQNGLERRCCPLGFFAMRSWHILTELRY